jgi:hypothetical protein
MLACRSDGDFARARDSTARIAGGIAAPDPLTSGGCSVRCFTTTTCAVAPWNGGSPVNIS